MSRYIVILSTKNGVVGKRFYVDAEEITRAKEIAIFEIKRRFGYYISRGYSKVRVEKHN